MQVASADGTLLHVESTGSGTTALVCAHGWMGNVRWWDAVRDALATTFQIVTLDLAGHGASARRARPSSEGYAADIVAAVRATTSQVERIVLVGHSMSGVYVLLAAPHIERLAQIVLVDTLKNLDQLPTLAQVEPILAGYRQDYATAVRTMMPRYLFTPQTPAPVVDRLTREFLGVTGDVAAELLLPLYDTDPRAAARAVRVPVRAIGGDGGDGASLAVNRTYFADYDYVALPGCGHYPMLERPEDFTAALRASLQ